MISYATYKFIHYVGIFTLVVTLTAALSRSAVLPEGVEDPWRKRLGRLHGLALLVIVFGGFGLMSRIGISHGELYPGWIWAKFLIWVAAGGLIALAARRSRSAPMVVVLLPLLAAAAGALALTKPF